GARPTKDGLSGVQWHLTDTSNLPVEALELEYPMTVLRYELVNSSGGAGTYCGGMGLRRVYRAEADWQLSLDCSRLTSQPWGLAGGLPGAPSRYDFGDGNKTTRSAVTVKKGQIVEIVTPGAGGYGPPEKRDRTAIARDLSEGRIDASFVEEFYGYSV
ncbi:MAG: hydantoinase B/oxoprolinase family protein, partial [Rhodospirillales bacterium]|nr:hydantoinase B/oxoprolinase family protein [Rhodospirillales bacterium]